MHDKQAMDKIYAPIQGKTNALTNINKIEDCAIGS